MHTAYALPCAQLCYCTRTRARTHASNGAYRLDPRALVDAPRCSEDPAASSVCTLAQVAAVLAEAEGAEERLL